MTQASREGGRLEGLDLARYAAFVGMVLVNFRIAMGAEGGAGPADAAISALEGRAAATFVVLAGIGLGLAGRRAPRRAVLPTVRRAAFLLALGLLNMTVFEADILHYYAVYFLFGAFLLPLAGGALVGAILALNVAFVAMILTLDYDAGWNWEDYSYAGLWTPAGFARNLFFNGWHPVVPWLGFLLLGIVLSRLRLRERRTRLGLLLGGALALIAAEAASTRLAGLLAALDPELAILATTAPVPPMPLYVLAGAGAACATVGACLMAEGPMRRRGVLRVLAPAGRQTLTLYIAHVLIGMGSLEALGLLGGQTAERAALAALAFCAAATLYAVLWARAFERGPVETLMRRIAG